MLQTFVWQHCQWHCLQKYFCLKLPNSVRNAKKFLEAMPLAMLPTKSLQHCQDQMIRANVCTSYCNVSTMAIDLKNIFALFFRFLPSDENWAKYSLQMDNCALFVTIIPSIDRFVIASKSMILYKINLMYDFLRDITIFLAGFLKWIELHNKILIP